MAFQTNVKAATCLPSPDTGQITESASKCDDDADMEIVVVYCGVEKGRVQD